ncbi:MAG: phosphate acyltransferase [Firmicutes bacterium HGW-Firmicutes-1]|jgi:glycerol-3-phosphate acyltransferase PlsX|nr:MAG: phosphate acyltransferase [Firmicutes bacterium HGW-Firmicutes-1]
MNYLRVAVDAMGGDHAPNSVVTGCIEAINHEKNIQVLLVGKEALIKEELKKHNYNKEQVVVVNADEIIENCESPVMAIRRKKDSSIVVGLRLVKEQQAEAFVSAGSTGAVLAGGTIIVGRIKGIERPALASFIPNEKGFTLLLDCGANVDCKPSQLVQFAQMGSIYYESFMNKKIPSIALVNIGEEEEKGNNLAKETFALLKEEPSIHFVGNIEARDISKGNVDVIVCDGFVGNIILKYTEGFAMSLLGMIKKAILSSFVSKIGAILIKSSLKKMMKTLDYAEYGGAPLLGLNGLVVKTHGSSDSKAMKNTILQCNTFYKEKVNEKIKQKLSL